MSSVAALCFDLDGTLLRSEEIRNGVRRAYVLEAGGAWSADADREMAGLHLLGWATYMHERLGVRGPASEIAQALEARIEAVYREQIPLVPGAREVLERCAALWPLALATGSTRRLIDLVLERGGLREYFRVTVSVDEVGAAKPSPAVYLRAADLLRVAPERCVAVEDSANGVRAALAARMGVVAIVGSAAAVAKFSGTFDGVAIAELTDLSPDVVDRAARRTRRIS